MSDLLKILTKIEHQSDKNIPHTTDITIRNEINHILSNIKKSSTLEMSQSYFDTLQHIQEVLAGMVFRDKKTVSNSLLKFISDCDRLDDPWLRTYLFEKIKNDEYTIKIDLS